MDSARLDSIILTMLFSGYNIYKIVLSWSGSEKITWDSVHFSSMLIRGSRYFYSDHLISRDITALLTPRGRLTGGWVVAVLGPRVRIPAHCSALCAWYRVISADIKPGPAALCSLQLSDWASSRLQAGPSDRLLSSSLAWVSSPGSRLSSARKAEPRTRLWPRTPGPRHRAASCDGAVTSLSSDIKPQRGWPGQPRLDWPGAASPLAELFDQSLISESNQSAARADNGKLPGLVRPPLLAASGLAHGSSHSIGAFADISGKYWRVYYYSWSQSLRVRTNINEKWLPVSSAVYGISSWHLTELRVTSHHIIGCLGLVTRL